MTEQVADHEAIHNDCGVSCLPSFFASLERKLDSPLLQRAFDELKANPSAFVSVGEWANEVGVSREHLTRSISPIINPANDRATPKRPTTTAQLSPIR